MAVSEGKAQHYKRVPVTVMSRVQSGYLRSSMWVDVGCSGPQEPVVENIHAT